MTPGFDYCKKNPESVAKIFKKFFREDFDLLCSYPLNSQIHLIFACFSFFCGPYGLFLSLSFYSFQFSSFLTPSHFKRHVFTPFSLLLFSKLGVFLIFLHQSVKFLPLLMTGTMPGLIASLLPMTVICQMNPSLPFFILRYTDFLQSYKLWLRILLYRLTVECPRVAWSSLNYVAQKSGPVSRTLRSISITDPAPAEIVLPVCYNVCLEHPSSR